MARSRTATGPWRGTPLPRGRHKVPPEDVRASQRDRLLRAMLESVAASGYAATTVPDVVAAARVSRTTFYDHFEDKLDCFLALCNKEAEGLLEATLSAAAAEPTWRGAVARGMEGYLGYWQSRPDFSRAYMVELPVAGAPASAQRTAASEPFRRLFEDIGRRARQEEPSLAPLPTLSPRMLVVGITELVAEEVREGRVDRLVELAPRLSEVTIALLGGAPA